MMSQYLKTYPILKNINDWYTSEGNVYHFMPDNNKENILIGKLNDNGEAFDYMMFYYTSLSQEFIDVVNNNPLAMLRYFKEFLEYKFDLSIFRKYNLYLTFPINNMKQYKIYF